MRYILAKSGIVSGVPTPGLAIGYNIRYAVLIKYDTYWAAWKGIGGGGGP